MSNIYAAVYIVETLFYLGTCEASWFDSNRFRIVRPIRDSIRIDGPIRNFRIVRAVNHHS